MYPIRLLTGLLLILTLSPTALALRTDRDKPIDIKADRVEVNDQKEVSHYNGNVQLQQGSMNIYAQKVTVYLQQGKLQKIVIDGEPATFEQQPEDQKDVVRSSANNMEYFADRQLLLLRNNASVVQGANRFSGDYIEYDTLNSTVKANKDINSDSRVHAIIQPGNSESTSEDKTQSATEAAPAPETPPSAPAPENQPAGQLTP